MEAAYTLISDTVFGGVPQRIACFSVMLKTCCNYFQKNATIQAGGSRGNASCRPLDPFAWSSTTPSDMMCLLSTPLKQMSLISDNFTPFPDESTKFQDSDVL
jgi:hypothetical protein